MNIILFHEQALIFGFLIGTFAFLFVVGLFTIFILGFFFRFFFRFFFNRCFISRIFVVIVIVFIVVLFRFRSNISLARICAAVSQRSTAISAIIANRIAGRKAAIKPRPEGARTNLQTASADLREDALNGFQHRAGHTSETTGHAVAQKATNTTHVCKCPTNEAVDFPALNTVSITSGLFCLFPIYLLSYR